MANFLSNLLGKWRTKELVGGSFKPDDSVYWVRVINLAPGSYLTKYGVSLVKRRQFYTWFASETMDKREPSLWFDDPSSDYLSAGDIFSKIFLCVTGPSFSLAPSIHQSIYWAGGMEPAEYTTKKSQQKEEKKVHFLNRNYSDDDRFLSLHWFQLIDYFFDHFFFLVPPFCRP